MGGATGCPAYRAGRLYISIHAPRGGSDFQVLACRHGGGISIHAPRGGSDEPWRGEADARRNISIHAPRGGSDKQWIPRNWTAMNFNPRSPWGERQFLDRCGRQRDHISIHAPRGGSDVGHHALLSLGDIFQSTLPVGGATIKILIVPCQRPISIHAPRGGSDQAFSVDPVVDVYFNPRSPWGERLATCLAIEFPGIFQSTLPVGGATRPGWALRVRPSISIHAPRGGSDSVIESLGSAAIISIHAPRGGSDGSLIAALTKRGVFQSTLPVGGATPPVNDDSITLVLISIHAPRGGSDRTSRPRRSCSVHFNPRSPWGERPFA